MNCSTRRLGWLSLSLLLLFASSVMELHAQTVWLSTNQLNFGNQAIFTTGVSRSVTLKNTGTASLQITGITSPVAPFSETSTSCSGSVAPGKSCTISVTFSPTKAGDFKGSISITDNAAGSPQIVSLKGTGVPQAALSPNPLIFGLVGVGSTSTAEAATLQNNLNTSLTITSIAASGDFAVPSNTCGSSVPAGGQCQIAVTFTPTQLGIRSGSLTVRDSANNSPQTISLVGTGTFAGLISISVTPANVSIPVGSTQQFTATGTFPTGIRLNLTQLVLWSSSASNVATISNSLGSQGLATGKAAGTTTIKATSINNVFGSTSVTVGSKPTATVTLSNLTQTYDGTPKSVTVTTIPAGLAVIVTYNGSTTPPTNAGSYTVVATVNDPNYQGNATGTLTIQPAPATITLSNLTQTYDGTPRSATVTTSPTNLAVIVTYNGSTTPPTNAASYVVVASLNNANYTAPNATGSLVINPASAMVTLSSLTQAYTGAALTPTVATVPPNLTVTWTGAPDTNAGTYPVTATISNPNYAGSASGSFAISPAAATVTLGNLTQTYTGAALTPTATTVPANLTVTWTGAPDTNAGTYPVTATVTNPNYMGSASGSFVISPAAATVMLGNLMQTYTGSALTPTATTVPASLAVALTGAPDTNAGMYPVTATVSDTNYTGSTSGTLVIGQATPVISWTTPAAITSGTALSSAQLNATGSVPGVFVYSPLAGTVLPAGSQTLSVTFMPTDATNYTTATASVNLTVTASTGNVNFAPGANLQVARDPFTSTLLNDGTVLIAGGYSSPGVVSPTAEIYNVAGLLTMRSPRAYHTATLLNNGMVLLVGGYTYDGSGNLVALDSAELYDPSLPGFITTNGSPTTARAQHTATLLRDGTVLIVGGADANNNALFTAEIYNPVVRTFTPAGVSLFQARYEHTANLLNDGTVLFAGGETESTRQFPTASAELYTPATPSSPASFATVGSNMVIARAYHTATLLNDGTVLFTGGVDSTITPVRSAELYTPSGFQPNFTPAMSTPRASHTATLLENGTVLIVGGATDYNPPAAGVPPIGDPTTSVEIYDPAGGFGPALDSTGTITLTLQTARSQHTATLLTDGTVLIAGGTTDNLGTTTNTTETCQPSTLHPPNLQSIAVMPAPPARLAPQTSEQFTAIGTFYIPSSNSTYTQQLASVTWSSTDSSGGPNVAQISNDAGNRGLAFAKNPGSAAITATAGAGSGAITGSATLNVKALASISVSTANPTVLQRSTLQFFATGTLSDGTTQDLTAVASWGSVPAVVATVGPTGLATGVSVGSANITATFGGIASSPVTLTVLPSLATITLTPANIGLPLGSIQPYTATGTDTIGNPTDLTTVASWGISNFYNAAGSIVAVISNHPGSQGFATSVGCGSTTVAATDSGITGTTTVSTTMAGLSFQGGFGCTSPTVPANFSQNPTNFQRSGIMLQGRDFHTATTLVCPSSNPNCSYGGKALIVGGANPGPLYDAEIYDPSTQSFAYALDSNGNICGPNYARFAHTATVLQDGRVLIAGGATNYYSDVPTATAELYEPVTGCFRTTGSLNFAQSGHTATILPDGNVLIVGDSIELYNTANGTFSYPTGSYPTIGATGQYTASTLLPDGDVLVVGGSYGNGGGSRNALALLYNPSTQSFALAANPLTIRNGYTRCFEKCAPTATLLQDGRVLIAGGPTDYYNTIPTAAAELYDPTSNTFTATGSMKTARFNHTATLLPDGRVLITGGIPDPSGTLVSLNSSEIYDPATGTFAYTKDPAGLTTGLFKPRKNHAATLVGTPPVQTVLITGGSPSSDSADPCFSDCYWSPSAELYQPSSGSSGAVLTSINVTPSDAPLYTALRFIAIGTFSDGTREVLTSSVTWTSDSTVVSILPDGEATTAGVPGSAHITACSGICQITTVTVQ